MSDVAYLDTHAAVWLAAGEVGRLSARAKEEIEACQLRLSPMAYFELDYLFRRKRCALAAGAMYALLNTSFEVQICTLPFPLIAEVATGCDWTTDPFDRMIVANAIVSQNAKLITADEKIRSHYGQAVW